jgi:ParB-like chromosome segregation protein Spo0J
MVRGNKFIKFDDIELKKLYVGKSNFRTENVNEGIDELMDHIYVNDLLETIVVYAVDDLKEDNDMLESRKDKQGKGLFEILAGQRRFAAFKNLDKKYPGEGFEKIPCHIRRPPDDELDAKAISIGENLTQLPVTLADAIDACDVLFKKYGDEKIVAKRYGISEHIIKKYVKFARLPKLLQDIVPELHKNAKSGLNIALDAADSIDWDRDDPKSVEKVVDFAKRIAKKKKISPSEGKKIVKAAKENPTKSPADIEKIGEGLREPQKFSPILEPDQADRLKESAEKNGNTADEEAADIIIEGLETRISKN